MVGWLRDGDMGTWLALFGTRVRTTFQAWAVPDMAVHHAPWLCCCCGLTQVAYDTQDDEFMSTGVVQVGTEAVVVPMHACVCVCVCVRVCVCVWPQFGILHPHSLSFYLHDAPPSALPPQEYCKAHWQGAAYQANALVVRVRLHWHAASPRR